MTTTPNLGLTKDALTDLYSVDRVNTNSDKIDEFAGQVNAAISAMDAAEVGGAGKYIKSISETDGVISATAETMDTTPTQDSAKAVTSGGVYTPLAEDRAALVELVDSGAKNKLNYSKTGRSGSYAATYTDNGVTYTVNSDQSISLSGTAGSGGSYIYCADSSTINVSELCNGDNVLSGTVVVDSVVKASVRARASSVSDYLVTDSGDGATLKTTSFTGNIYVSVRIEAGVNVDGVTVKPMICPSAAWAISKAPQPYRPSYQELYERVVALENA